MKYRSSKIRKQINRRVEKLQKREVIARVSPVSIPQVPSQLPPQILAKKNLAEELSPMHRVVSEDMEYRHTSSRSQAPSAPISGRVLKSTISSTLDLIEKDDFATSLFPSAPSCITGWRRANTTFTSDGNTSSHPPEDLRSKLSRVLGCTLDVISAEDPFEPIPLFEQRPDEQRFFVRNPNLDPLDEMAERIVKNEGAWTAY